MSSAIIAIVNLLCFVQYYVMLQFHHVTSRKKTQIIYYMYDIFDLSVLICQQRHIFVIYAFNFSQIFSALLTLSRMIRDILCILWATFLQ